jgi:hypothetical protein
MSRVVRSLSKSGPKDKDDVERLNWFLKPHEIIALVLTTSVVVYLVFTRDVSSTPENVKACELFVNAGASMS